MTAAQLFIDMIHSVEQRCMAADGPVTPTCDEITDAELRKVYEVAVAEVAALASSGVAAQPVGEPVVWMYQHDETGRIGFVDTWQKGNGFEAANPRLKIVAPLYTRPSAQEAPPSQPVEVELLTDEEKLPAKQAYAWGPKFEEAIQRAAFAKAGIKVKGDAP